MFLKNKNISSKIKRSKVTDYAALMTHQPMWVISEACIGVLGIQDIGHFTSRDIGYYPFYFQGYGILGSIFSLLPGILKI